MNRVQLIGRLVADCEIRHTPAGVAVCEFTLAVTKRWKTKAGEQKERTSFIGCYLWDRRGEAFARYHRKGVLAAVEGELAQDRWEKDGQKHSKTRVEVHDFTLLPSRDGGSTQGRETAANAPEAVLQHATEDADKNPLF